MNNNRKPSFFLIFLGQSFPGVLGCLLSILFVHEQLWLAGAIFGYSSHWIVEAFRFWARAEKSWKEFEQFEQFELLDSEKIKP